MVPTQVMGEMILDGGGHFIPAGIVGLHTQSSLLAPLVAHDRATEDTHKHTKEHKYLDQRKDLYTNTRDNTKRGYST